MTLRMMSQMRRPSITSRFNRSSVSSDCSSETIESFNESASVFLLLLRVFSNRKNEMKREIGRERKRKGPEKRREKWEIDRGREKWREKGTDERTEKL